VRVLFLGINYWPEQTGNATFVVGRCEHLASQGHQVSICTAYPYYPEWRIRDDYSGRWFSREERNGVQIFRAPLYVPRKATALRRVLHEASFIASSSLSAFRRRRPDILYVVSAPLGLAASAYLLSRCWHVPYVLYVSDMQPDAAGELKMLPGPVMRCLYGLERFAYRHAAIVATLTGGMRRRIISKGVPPEKVVVFSHCAEPSLFDVPARGGGAAFRLTHGLDGQFIVLHSGNMGVKQGLEVVIDAAARTRADKSIVYLLVGDGVARPALQERARALELDNVRFLPVQPREVFRDMLGAADICVITERASVGDILFPGKTIDFLAAGRAVIGSLSASTEVGRILGDAGAGLVVPPENPDALAEAVLRLRNDDELRSRLSRQGRAYAREHWDRDRVLPYFEKTLLQLVGSKTTQRSAA
jgi:colanic acid biosynthesis glycosyl transferase WcaI